MKGSYLDKDGVKHTVIMADTEAQNAVRIPGFEYKVAKILSYQESLESYTVVECTAAGMVATGEKNVTGVKNLGPGTPEIGDKVVIVKTHDGDWAFQT